MSPSRKGIANKRSRTHPLVHAKKRARTTPKPNRACYPFDSHAEDTSQQGRHAFEWLIHPIRLSTFFSRHFETEPFHLRNTAEKFRSLASLPAIKQLLTSRKLTYDHLDVTSYTPAGGRKTHTVGQGIAGKEAWEKFVSGCSLRLRRPQSHFPGIHKLCSYLESFLECVVGANVYATPADSQGFAAHFDDVDAVICQIEGTKRWRVYKRSDEHDVLPRRSSVDFSAAEVADMKRVMDVVLEAGDVLYLPRGAVHEACCEKRESLHVTISFCQRWTWADLLIGSFERAVLETAAVDQRLRESVPLRFGRVAGVGVEGGVMGERFGKMVRRMVGIVANNYPVDFAADKMMEGFIQGRLPVDSGIRGKVVAGSSVKLVASCCVRLVVGDDGLPVLVTKDSRQTCLPEEAGAIKFVVDSYPDSVSVDDIPLERMEDRLELARGLVEMGVLQVLR